MALKITIAKVRHEGLLDALKLVPLVKRAHVVSIENAHATEDDALKLEQGYRDEVYSLNWSNRQIKAGKNIINGFVRDRLYNAGRSAIIIHYGKPIILAERHSPEESARSRELYNKIKYQAEEILSLRRAGIIQRWYEEAMRLCYEAAKSIAYYIHVRDSNVVANMPTIEHRIIELYPHLAGTNPIEYLIEMGANHRLDQGLQSVPNAGIEVVNLSRSSPNRYTQIVAKIMSQNASFEECRADIASFLRISLR